MSTDRQLITKVAIPWLGFFGGCCLALLAYAIDGTGLWRLVLIAGLMLFGFALCAVSPWLLKDTDPSGRGLLSLFSCAAYVLLVAWLLFHSFSVGGLPVD